MYYALKLETAYFTRCSPFSGAHVTRIYKCSKSFTVTRRYKLDYSINPLFEIEVFQPQVGADIYRDSREAKNINFCEIQPRKMCKLFGRGAHQRSSIIIIILWCIQR